MPRSQAATACMGHFLGSRGLFINVVHIHEFHVTNDYVCEYVSCCHRLGKRQKGRKARSPPFSSSQNNMKLARRKGCLFCFCGANADPVSEDTVEARKEWKPTPCQANAEGTSSCDKACHPERAAFLAVDDEQYKRDARKNGNSCIGHDTVGDLGDIARKEEQSNPLSTVEDTASKVPSSAVQADEQECNRETSSPTSLEFGLESNERSRTKPVKNERSRSSHTQTLHRLVSQLEALQMEISEVNEMISSDPNLDEEVMSTQR